jgi:hypothetical protein
MGTASECAIIFHETSGARLSKNCCTRFFCSALVSSMLMQNQGLYLHLSLNELVLTKPQHAKKIAAIILRSKSCEEKRA